MKYSKSENEGKQNNKNLWRINKRHITMYTMIILPIGRTSGVLAVSGQLKRPQVKELSLTS